MRRKLSIILIALLLLLCACQPTPDEPIVIGKDQRPMIEQAKDTPKIEPEPTPVLELVQESFESNGVSVEIDATVTVPGGAMPIVRVHGADFSQEQIDKFWNVLIGDTAMYPYEPETKKDIEKRIKAEQRAIDELETQKARGESYDEELLEASYDTLNILKEMYADAPEGTERIPIGSRLCVRDDGVTYVMAFEDPANWVKRDGKRFDVLNNRPTPYGKGKPLAYQAVMRFTKLSADSDEAFYGDIAERDLRPIAITDMTPEGSKLSMTPVQAMREAADWTERLGVPFAPVRLTLVRDSHKRQAYLVECGRVVNGVPTAPMEPDSYSRNEAQETVTVDWTYETFQMLICDDGLYAVRWNSPIAVEDTVVENSNLLPFSEILSMFRKMMPIRYASSFADRTEVFRIEEIRLELVRVLEQNAQNSGLLVPVWCFYGTHRTKAKNWKEDDAYGCQLMINAVNGSIIDPMQGY